MTRFSTQKNAHPVSKRLILVSALAVYLLILCLGLIRPAFFIHLENGLTDRVLRSDPGRKSGRIAVVDIDEETLKAFGQWPWPRYRIARLIERIEAAGAASIGVNMIFPEADRTSPKEIESHFLKEQGLRIDLSNVPKDRFDHDETLAGVLADSRSILGFEFLFAGESPTNPLCPDDPINVGWINPSRQEEAASHMFEASGALCSIEPLSRAAVASGFLNPTLDTDGTVRRSTLLVRHMEEYYPSLALAAVMEALQTRQVLLHLGHGGVDEIILDGTAIPVDPKCNLLLHYRGGARTFDYVSARDLFSGSPAGTRLKGKIVFLGISAVGLYENLKTPFDLTYPNVEVQATVADNILKGDFVSRPYWGTAIELLAALAGALACVLMLWVHPLIIGTAAAAGVFGIWEGAQWLYAAEGVLVSPLYPILATAANLAFVSVIKYWHKERWERREKEEALSHLEASERTLGSIMKTIPDIVYRLNPSGEITFVNQAVSHYGYDPEQLLGTRFLDLVFPMDREWAARNINERRTGPRATVGLEIRLVVRGEAPLTGEDGLRHVLISSEGLYEGDVPETKTFKGTQGIARDITERKHLETQLVQAKKMEALGTLAGGIAHDFNNLLMGVQGNASLLLMEEDLPEPLFSRLKNIEEYVQKGSRLTRQLLGLGKQDSVHVKPTRLNPLIQKNLDLFQRTKKDIRVQEQYQEDLWPVRLDRGQFEQVLLNLFVNAWQAMPSGGTLSVETSNVQLNPQEVIAFDADPGNYVRIAVGDDGVGMDSETLSRVFDPFFTTKQDKGGTGLGLSSVYGIVKKHSGIVRAESEEGVGTSFEIFLPAHDGQAEDETERRPAVTGGDETLLLVDDEEMVLDVASAMLKKLGYTVLSASGGEEALEVYDRMQEGVALVILDLVMPDMGGLETFQRLKEISPDLKVLFASGYARPQDAEALSDGRQSGFIQKPYKIQELSIKLREILDD